MEKMYTKEDDLSREEGTSRTTQKGQQRKIPKETAVRQLLVDEFIAPDRAGNAS